VGHLPRREAARDWRSVVLGVAGVGDDSFEDCLASRNVHSGHSAGAIDPNSDPVIGS
jgi:hypothetical protein